MGYEVAGAVWTCVVRKRDSGDESLVEFREYFVEVIVWWPVLNEYDAVTSSITMGQEWH
jgi:hypothetical protein